MRRRQRGPLLRLVRIVIRQHVKRQHVKRLPTRVTFQPVRQQKGLVVVHSQCFWNNQKPMPFFDQSVARHVGLDLSKIRTPSSILLIITALDSSKSWFNSSFHVNGDPGLRASRKGSMRSVAANAYDT